MVENPNNRDGERMPPKLFSVNPKELLGDRLIAVALPQGDFSGTTFSKRKCDPLQLVSVVDNQGEILRLPYQGYRRSLLAMQRNVESIQAKDVTSEIVAENYPGQEALTPLQYVEQMKALHPEDDRRIAAHILDGWKMVVGDVGNETSALAALFQFAFSKLTDKTPSDIKMILESPSHDLYPGDLLSEQIEEETLSFAQGTSFLAEAIAGSGMSYPAMLKHALAIVRTAYREIDTEKIGRHQIQGFLNRPEVNKKFAEVTSPSSIQNRKSLLQWSILRSIDTMITTDNGAIPELLSSIFFGPPDFSYAAVTFAFDSLEERNITTSEDLITATNEKMLVKLYRDSQGATDPSPTELAIIRRMSQQGSLFDESTNTGLYGGVVQIRQIARVVERAQNVEDKRVTQLLEKIANETQLSHLASLTFDLDRMLKGLPPLSELVTGVDRRLILWLNNLAPKLKPEPTPATIIYPPVPDKSKETTPEPVAPVEPTRPIDIVKPIKPVAPPRITPPVLPTKESVPPTAKKESNFWTDREGVVQHIRSVAREIFGDTLEADIFPDIVNHYNVANMYGKIDSGIAIKSFFSRNLQSIAEKGNLSPFSPEVKYLIGLFYVSVTEKNLLKSKENLDTQEQVTHEQKRYEADRLLKIFETNGGLAEKKQIILYSILHMNRSQRSEFFRDSIFDLTNQDLVLARLTRRGLLRDRSQPSAQPSEVEEDAEASSDSSTGEIFGRKDWFANRFTADSPVLSDEDRNQVTAMIAAIVVDSLPLRQEHWQYLGDSNGNVGRDAVDASVSERLAQIMHDAGWHKRTPEVVMLIGGICRRMLREHQDENESLPLVIGLLDNFLTDFREDSNNRMLATKESYQQLLEFLFYLEPNDPRYEEGIAILKLGKGRSGITKVITDYLLDVT